MKNLLIALMAILLISGCKTKQQTVESHSVESSEDILVQMNREKERLNETVTKKDSVYVERTPATKVSIVVDNPCDSLTKRLRDFEHRQGKTVVKSTGGKITVESECDETVKRYQHGLHLFEMERDKLVERLDSSKSAYFSLKKSRAVTVKQPFWIWLPFWIGMAMPVLAWLIFKFLL